MTPRPTRRRLLALLLTCALPPSTLRRALAEPGDRGIGGTGVTFGDENDRGIGGTGVIGTIRRFGSIVVNDLRIAYPPEAEVRIDDRPAGVRDLKIGQVVRVVASRAAGGLATHRIDVTSEVVGPVEAFGPGRLVVLGQSVATAGLKIHVRPGETVAVSGLRRNDGTVVASLVEPRPGAPSRVAGPVRVGADGALRIGGLALSGADPSLVDRRAVVDGRSVGDRFVVATARAASDLFPPDVRALSIESYVERHGSDLSLGSGYAVAGDVPQLPAGRSVRAVLTTRVGADGRLTLDAARVGDRTFAPAGHGAPGRGGSPSGPDHPGRPEAPATGRPPMTFDRGPGGFPGGGPTGGPGGGPPGGFGGPGPFGGPGGFGGMGGGRR